jgi:uncharacterized membrane protein
VKRLDARLVLAGEVALAALLGFIALGNRSFWLDESLSVTLTKLDWGAFVDELQVREANMSLYYLLLSWWTAIGDSETAVRSLSVLAFAATVAVGYLLVKRLAGVRPALVAGLLLAVNPMLVRYGQEARGYALCVLLVTAGVYLFVRGVQEPGWPVWIAYAIVAALSVYSHFFALLIPPAMAVSLLFVRRDAVPWRMVIAAASLFVGLLSLFFVMLSTVDPDHGGWVVNNAIGRKFEPLRENRPVAAALLLVGLIVAVGSWLLVRRRFGARLQAPVVWRWAVLVAWVLVPPALVVALALTSRPLFVARYFIVCVPAVLFLTAMLIDRIRRPVLSTIAVAVLVVASLAGVVRWYAGGQVEDWRGAAAYVSQEATPQDGVQLYAPYVRIPFGLYFDRGDPGELAQPVYPADGWETSPVRFNETIPIGASDIAESAGRFQRIWLVLSHVGLFGRSDSRYEAILEGLASAGFAEKGREQLDGIEVRRFERTGG